MARQKGILPLSGSVGKINYYQTKDGDFAREKAKIDIATLLYGKEFANSRKAGTVFGLASIASRLIRTALDEMIMAGSNRDMHNLTLTTLQENAKGATTLHQLPFHQLRGLNFNKKTLFTSICTVPYAIEIHAPGKVSVVFPAFNPVACMKKPPKTTHFRFTAGIVALDCNKAAYKREIKSTPEILRKQAATEPIQLNLSVPVKPHQPWLVALGLIFSTKTNNSFDDSENIRFLPVMISEVVYDPPPPPVPPKAAKKKKKGSLAKKAKNSTLVQKKPGRRK